MMDSDDDLLNDMMDQIEEGESQEEDWMDTGWAQPVSASHTAGARSIYESTQSTSKVVQTTAEAKSSSDTVSGDLTVVQRMLLNDNKAGMDGLDKQKINQIIHEASKGSKFYENERNKEEQMKKRIAVQKQKIENISAAQLQQGLFEADRLLEDFEQQRDLTHTIVHIDMDAFYAAVEMRDKPSLKNKPMAVGSNSMLSTSNYHARKFGVRAAMPGFIGKKLCPDLVIMPLSFDKYTEVSKQVKSLIAEYDPNFCPMSLDEAYLDITDHLERRKEMTESERTCICRDRNYTDSTSHCLCDLNEVVRRYGSNLVFCDINCDKKDENKEVVSTEDKSSLDLHAHFMNGSITANPHVKSDTSGDILLKGDEALETITELDKRSGDHCIKKTKRDLLCPLCGREFPPFTLLTFGLSDEDAVNELRMRIEQRTRLTASAGIAPNMMLAKVCSDKNKPNGQFKIHATRQDVMTFIKDLPTRKISGIGKVSEAMLNAMGVYTCTDLYEERALLYQLYSPISFNYFMRICLGIGSTTVERDSERKSISTERTFSEINKPADLFRKCEELSESLANDLKEEELKGKTVSIKIKTVKFEVKTRAHTLRDYTNDKDVILQAALELLKTEIQLCAPQPLRLRLMGVRMSSLLHQKLCKDKRQNTIFGAFKKLAEKVPKSDVDEHVSDTNDDIKLSNIHFKAKADADTLTQSVDDVTKFSVGFGIPNSVMQAKSTFTEENSLGSSTTVYTTSSEDVHDVAADEKKGSLENMNIPVTIQMPKPVPVNEFIPEEVIEENKLLDNLSVDFRIQEPINDFFTDCSQINDPSFDDESRCKKLKTTNEPETVLLPSDVQSNSCVTSIQNINCDTSNSVDNTCLDNARKEIEDQNEIIQYEEETGSSIRSSKIDENFEPNCKSTDDVNLPPRQNIKESANATSIVHVGTKGTRKNRSGLVRTPNRRPTKRRRNSKRQEEISYLCPICSRNILCSSLNDFNEHVDDCLENDNKEVTEEFLDESKEIKGVHNLLSKEDIVDNSNFDSARKQGLPLNLNETQTSSENSVENVNMFENCSRVQSEGSFIKISCENTKVNLTVESSGSETNANIDIEVSGQKSDTFDHNQIGFNENNTDIEVSGLENEIFDPDNVEFNENTFNVIKKEEASFETIDNKNTYMKHITENSLELDVSRDEVVKVATVGNNIGVESKIGTYKGKIRAGEKIIETYTSVESNETDKTNLQFDQMKLPLFNESKLLSLDIMKLPSLDKMKPLSLDEVKLPSMEMSDCQSPSCSSAISCKQFEIVDINCNIKSGEHVPLKPVTIVNNDSDGDPYSLIASSNDNAASTENKCDKNSLVSTRSVGSDCESTIQAEISIQDNSSDEIVEFHQGVAVETSEVEDDTDNGSDEDAGGLLVCPICNTEQRSASLTEFNSHVDACLSRGTISEILREQRQVEKSTKKRVNSSRNTPGSSQKSKHRKTMLPEKTPSCRSIYSFFTLK